MKWFEGIDNLKDLYRMKIRLSRKYHPDVGGDTATMQSINAEYDKVCAELKGEYDSEIDFTYTSDTGFNDSDFTSAYYDAEFDDSDFETVENDFSDWLEKLAQINSVKSEFTEWLKKIFRGFASEENILGSVENEIVRDRERIYKFVRQRELNRRRNCRAA